MSERSVPLDRLPPLRVDDAGLTTAMVEAQRRHGFNDIVAEASSGWLAIALDTARDPMLWFLVLTAGLFGLVGQVSEALTLLMATMPLVGMDAFLHRRTMASSAGLASRLASSARVLRDGRWRDIPARELVPGDLAEVKAGEYFPADGLLVSGARLQADESTLTGESLPVPKRVVEPMQAALPASAPEDQWGVAGTRLLTGQALLRIVCTGATTRYGEITRSATGGGHATTPLQEAIGQLVAVLLGVAVAICFVLAAIRLWQGHGWIDALVSAMTLAIAALPEEFPVVYTFFLGVGVFRLARKKTLVRRAVAVENVGRVTCIVSDKTGTITSGSLVLAHRLPAMGEDAASVLRVAALASGPDGNDPLDKALHEALGGPAEGLEVRRFPFTEGRRRETVIRQSTARHPTAFTKGAPETVLAMCGLSKAERADWLARVEEYAGSGHKVLGCARHELRSGEGADKEPVEGFEFVGLLAFEDPVRPGVREAVGDCTGMGMRVIMVTGDHPATAAAVARQIGLGGDMPGVVVLAPDDDAAAALRAHGEVHVVARATPSQKLVLVQTLQAQGELVAVTGDGVNDVPALRLADVGVAMGERGTQSAREVAAIVLLDDNFRTIIDAVAEGRQLFQNLRLAFAYLLLVHMPLVLGAAVIPLMGLPLLFLPIHIVWLELVIHPTAMLAFQDLSHMATPGFVSHSRRARFYSTGSWLEIGMIGAMLSVAVVWSYLHALGTDRDIEHARAMALSVLLTASVCITIGLTKLRGAAARWLVVGTLASLGLLVQVPELSRLVNVRPLHAMDWMLVGLFALATCAMTLLLADRMRRHGD